MTPCEVASVRHSVLVVPYGIPVTPPAIATEHDGFVNNVRLIQIKTNRIESKSQFCTANRTTMYYKQLIQVSKLQQKQRLSSINKSDAQLHLSTKRFCHWANIASVFEH